MSSNRLSARAAAALRRSWAIFMFLSACSPSAPTELVDTRRSVDRVPPPRIEILQSDVLVIDGRHLHLADARTPQAAPNARCTAEAALAHQAQLRLKRLAEGVSAASVRTTGRVDSDQRAYAHVLLDGLDPAPILIDEGLAVSPDARRFDWCAPLSSALPEARHIAVLSLGG